MKSKTAQKPKVKTEKIEWHYPQWGNYYAVGKSDEEMRISAMDFALRNKPLGVFETTEMGVRKSKVPKYDLIAESKKIYNWLKTGK